MGKSSGSFNIQIWSQLSKAGQVQTKHLLTGFTKLRELVSLSNIIAIADIYGFCTPLCTPTPTSIDLLEQNGGWLWSVKAKLALTTHGFSYTSGRRAIESGMYGLESKKKGARCFWVLVSKMEEFLTDDGKVLNKKDEHLEQDGGANGTNDGDESNWPIKKDGYIRGEI